MIEAYPLQWPVGYPRTEWYEIKEARFDTSFAGARDAIVSEIKRFGGSDAIISTNIPVRNDGLPYANYSKPKDAGVSVYFTYKKNQVVFACDKWKRIEDNMQAVRKTIEAMRGLDRWGVSDMLNRAFTGFKALPEESSARQWWEILGVAKSAQRQDIVSAYRNLSKIHHPDMGGSASMFSSINEAYQQGLKQNN